MPCGRTTCSPPSRRPATRRRCRRLPRRHPTTTTAPLAKPAATRSSSRCGSASSSAAALTIPVVLLSMIPALQFEFWQWAALTLAAPVVTWGAWPFHRAALISAAARRLHDGHARLARYRGRLRLVAVRVVPRRCRRARHDDAVHPGAGPRFGRRRDLPRGRDRRHPVPAARPLPGGARPPAVRQRTARPAVDGRQGRRRDARGERGPAAGRPSCRWATSSSYGRGRRSRPTARSSAAPPPSTRRC